MSLITSKQVQTLQIARRQVARRSNGVFDDAAYRMLLVNCGAGSDSTGRVSSKLIDQTGFEHAMSVLEEMGFRQANEAEDYWRRRSSWRSGRASTRQVYEIKRLHTLESRYPLSVLCGRASNNVHATPEQLTPGQAHKLIEALKEIVERNKEAKCSTAPND